jgi:hypothetical protein
MNNFTLQVTSTVLITIMISSCKVDLVDGDTFTGGFTQKKSSSKSASIDGTPNENKTVAKGSYLVRVALHEIADSETSQVPTLQGLEASAKGCICIGKMFLHIKDDFSIEFPDSKLKCSLIGELDLEKILSGLNDNQDRDKAAAAEDKMLRLKKLGPVTFDPPRPLLVGPVIHDPLLFQGLTETKSYNVQYTDQDKDGAIIEDTGSITVNVLEAGARVTPTFMPNHPFDSIVRFEMLSSGFSKIPRTKGFLFNRVEFTLNSRPIAIPSIKIQSKAADLMAAAPKSDKGASITDSPLIQLFGKFIDVHIRLDATKFETY